MKAKAQKLSDKCRCRHKLSAHHSQAVHPGCVDFKCKGTRCTHSICPCGEFRKAKNTKKEKS